jgi:CO/xanthine dehydrogenase FAD-binding subunit
MKPHPFNYFRPENLNGALELLQEMKTDAVLLAGGQSLIPMMNMRLINSESVIDLSALKELRGIRLHENKIIIGAMTRYMDLKKSELLIENYPLMMDAIDYIAHSAVRNRGTVGGSLALSHPSAELPGCFVALNAEVIIESAQRGKRNLNSDEFIQGMMSTKLEADEMITGIELPISNNSRHWFGEVSRRQGDFCTAAVAMQAETEVGKVKNIRVVLVGVSDKPARLKNIERMLVAHEDNITIENIKNEISEKIELIDDIYNSAAGKLHIASELVFEGIKNFTGKK